MKKRIFIVGPNYDEDILWQICETTSKKPLDIIYSYDRYDVIDEVAHDFYDVARKMAIETAKKYGAKRPTII